MKVAGEKTAAVFLEKRPDLFAVGSGDVKLSDFVRGEKLKLTLFACEEGEFQFFTANEIGQLDIPRTDREQIWPLFQKHRGGFFSGHFHCIEGDAFEWTLEESRPATATQHE